MKKCCFLVILMLILTGCDNASKELERAMEFRSKLLKAESVCFTADISADYGDCIQLFSMDCTCDAQGNLSFTVASPETIRGITGTVSGGEGKLTFDNTAVRFGLMTDEQLNPASAPWILMKTLRSGYLRYAGMEDACLRLTIDDSYAQNALQLDIWLDEEDIPQRVEVCDGGRSILSLQINDFRIL